MAIATRAKRFLDHNKVGYQILNHERSNNLLEVIHKLKIPQKEILKAIPITDGLTTLLAILPWTYEIDFVSLEVELQSRFIILSQENSHPIFYDCDMGSVPPFGEAYDLDVILDSSLEKLDHVYVETGSQFTLLHMEMDDFRFLNGGAPLFSFAYPSRIKDSDEIVMKQTERKAEQDEAGDSQSKTAAYKLWARQLHYIID